MKRIFVTRNYEVYQISILKFLGLFTIVLLLLIVVISLLKFTDSILNIIVSSIISIAVSLLLTFYLTKKDFFNEKILGDILHGIDGNKERKIVSYRNAIKPRIGNNRIILPKKNQTLLNELELIFRTYESCLPIQIGKYPSIEETNVLFEELFREGNTLFEKFNLKANSLFHIYNLNSVYYTTYYTDIVKSKSLIKMEVPEELKLLFEINTKPIDSIADCFVNRLIEKRDVFANGLKLSIEKKEDIKLDFYNYCEELVALVDEINKNDKSSVYKSIKDIISLTILSQSSFVLWSIKSEKGRQLEVILSQRQIDRLAKIKYDISNKELNPVLEVYRKLILGLKMNIEEIYEFSRKFSKQFPILTTSCVNNFWLLLLKGKYINEFKRAYERLSPFYQEEIIIEGKFHQDHRLGSANFNLLYHFHNGTLNSSIVKGFHELVHRIYESEGELQIYQAIIFRFASIIDDSHLKEWYYDHSILSSEEMKLIEENLLDNFYFGSRITAENNLIYYCFPVAINKQDLGKYIT